MRVDICKVSILKHILCFLIIVFSIISVTLLVKTSIDLRAEGYVWSWTLNGVVFYFDKIKNFLWVIATPITLLPVILTIYTIQENTLAKEASALLDVRNALYLQNNIEVHENLRGDVGLWRKSIPKDNKTWMKIDNYLGTLE